MKITYGQLKEIIQEVMKEANVSSNAGAFTPKASFKSSAPFKTKVSRPKRPSHTKMFDFLEENNK